MSSGRLAGCEPMGSSMGHTALAQETGRDGGNEQDDRCGHRIWHEGGYPDGGGVNIACEAILLPTALSLFLHANRDQHSSIRLRGWPSFRHTNDLRRLTIKA